MRAGSPVMANRKSNSARQFPPSFPFVIGVAGGSSSGKTEVCQKIFEALGQDTKSVKERQVFVINQDSFYHSLSDNDQLKALNYLFNFDHPDAVDLKKLKDTIQAVKSGETVQLPQWDYLTHSMQSDEKHSDVVQSADVLIVEGILVFYDKDVRDLCDLKIFVDSDSDTRLARRVIRDTEERGRDLESVLSQYIRHVKPAFEEFCLPTKKYADLIIPRGNENAVAISLVVQHIQELLQCTNSRRSSLSHDSISRSSSSCASGSPISTSHHNSHDNLSTGTTYPSHSSGFFPNTSKVLKETNNTILSTHSQPSAKAQPLQSSSLPEPENASRAESCKKQILKPSLISVQPL